MDRSGPRPPPRWALRLLRWALPPDAARETVIGDLVEEYLALAREGREPTARRRFVRQAVGVALHALKDRIVETDLPGRGARENRRGDGMMRQWGRDFRIASRALMRAPGFAAIAAITLAIGIGANTAIFSAVNGVLLDPLRFPDSDALVAVRHTAPGFGYDEIPLSPDTYLLIKEENRGFESIGAYQLGARVNLTGDHDPRVLEAARVSWDLPSTLGLTFPLGRGFTSEEDLPEAPDVVVISHRLWEETYGSDPGIVGRVLQLDGTPMEVVGVLPRRVDVPTLGTDVWLPLRIDPDNPNIGAFGILAIARLQAGRTAEVAEANLAPVIDILSENMADAQTYLAFIQNGRLGMLVDPLKNEIVGDLEAPLWILLGTVGFVLLIACANVANLVMVRAESRQKEVAVRAALGAGRGVVMRSFVAESAILALAGGALGVGLAAAGLPALLALTPESLPRAEGVRIDGMVLVFTSLLVIFSILLFGVTPAARAFKPGMFGALKHARGTTDGRDRHRLRNFLVAGQTALALMLLIGSGLMLRSFDQLRKVDPGFEGDGVLTFNISLPPAGYPTTRSVADFHQLLSERLAALPGVVSSGAAEYVPLSGGGSGTPHRAEDVPVAPGGLPPVLWYKSVAPGYFETMGTSLLAGRTLTREDHEQGLPNVVINVDAAERMWPGQDALGRRLGVTSSDSVPLWYTVVGVVENVLDESLTDAPRELVYYAMVGPDGQDTPPGVRTMTHVVRTERDPSALAGPVRAAVWQLDSDLPITDMREMAAVVAESSARMSFTVIALAVAAIVALLLGAIGLYGVLSYIVAQRTREIGVRIALGAEGSSVRTMVVRQGLMVAGAGLAVGIVGALALTRVLESLLFGTSATDPLTFVATSGVLLLVGAVASYVPARRASGIDPMEALRAE